MRVADLVMAIIIAVFSIYLIFKSIELPATWVEGSGPGGGMFPLWLSIGMLICALVIIIKWLLRISPLSQSTQQFIQAQSLKPLGLVMLAVLLLVGLIHIIGVYGSVPLFLVFYLNYFGQHHWKTISLLAAGTPVVMFLLFEVGMKITLPKGYTEPLFLPLYDLFF